MSSRIIVKDGTYNEVNYKKFVENVFKEIKKYNKDATKQDAEAIASFYKEHFANWRPADR